ncbi:hypothetical protein [Gimesia sp.]|uniref:hypothetical protein n=1 Tax=Gimesia sp. TaxID=2024833 RepID=UPI003A8EB347
MFTGFNVSSNTEQSVASKTLKTPFVPVDSLLLPKVNNVKSTVEKQFQKISSFVSSGSTVQSLDFGGQAAYDNVLTQEVFFVQPETG